MNPSPIYQANTGNTQRLYYAPTGSTQLQQIANPNELQNLAQQGLVEVGKAYQQYDPSSGLTLPGQAPATPAAAPVTTPNAAPPTQNLEVQPGVFSASRLNDFYQNQFKDLKAQQDKLMSQLSQQNAAASSLTTPDFTGQYNTQFQSQVAPIDTQITTISGNVNKIDDALRNIETDIRNQIGGRAADSVIQARVAAEAAPLLKQRQAYTDQLTTLQNQRKNIVSQIETGLNLAQQQFQNQLSVDSVKRDVAQKAVDSLNSLIKAGYDATAEQQKAAQDTFKNFLTNVPEFLGTLSQDEYAQLQQGVVPYSAMSKLSEALQSKQNAETVKNAKIFGGADTGYYTLDQNGQTVQLVPPVAGGGGLTPSQIASTAAAMFSNDPFKYPTLDAAVADVQRIFGGGALPNIPAPSGVSGFSSPVQSGVLGSGAGGARTDRHNNPTAFTTDIAKQAGLVEGVDYVAGDAFPGNPNMKTARLLGDPMTETIKVIDNIGFYTANGQQRWTHTAMTKPQWDGLSTSQKQEVVKEMYRREGGDGSIFGSYTSEPQQTAAPQTNSQISDTLQKISSLVTKDVRSEVVRRVNNAIAQGNTDLAQEILNTQIDEINRKKLGNAGVENYSQYTTLQSFADELTSMIENKEVNTGALMGRIGTFLGAQGAGFKGAQTFNAILSDMNSSLLKLRSGAAVTPQEYERIKALLPSVDISESANKTRIEQFKKNLTEAQKNLEKRAGLIQRVGLSGYLDNIGA